MRRATTGFATILLGLVAAGSYAQAPVPLINQPLVPDATAPGGPAFTLTVNGTGFVSGSIVNWNGNALATTFIGGSQLTANVPPANIATASTARVTVVNPAPGGASNVAFFTVASNAGSSVAFFLGSSPGTGTGTEPVAIATGDFNGDSKLDLATANYDSNTVSILLGDGTGNFTLASSPATGGAPNFVAVGDFNGDGKLDLAVANFHSATVSVLLGDGTGNFTPASPVVTGGYPFSVAVGDFNRDGKLDLAVGFNDGNALSIFLGDGTGNFTLASSPAVCGTSGYPTEAVGDFNGDGKLDLAVTNCTCGTAILLGDGAGNFTLGSSPPPEYSWSPVIGDFNADDVLDLAVAQGNTVSVLLGNGTGSFTLASSLPADNTFAAAVGDFNDDNKLDLAVVNANSDSVSVWLGDGTGNFTLGGSPGTSSGALSFAVGDFNGDGRMDLAVANAYENSVWILLQAQPGSPVVTLSPSSLSFATQLVGTASASKTVTVSNTGTGPLDITSITASTNFLETNTCGASVAPGASCTIAVTFKPFGIGTLTGTLTITNNAPLSPQTVSLTGVGTVVRLSPGYLNFGKQPVGTASSAQAVTLFNRGQRPLEITNVILAGADAEDFAQTNNCGTVLPSGASCSISVTFTPQAKGSRTGTLNVYDDGGASPQTVTVKGYGT